MTPKAQFSPKDFLRSRRPERFSDSARASGLRLDRSILEHHIATLTERNQEKAFERFAIRLARRTICPNIRPQTGPSGGGDGKVDAETTPVAEDLALTWVVGFASQAHAERWAFAFSAMRDWRPKVHSDVRKIAATGRNYLRAIFISNQAIPDRKRLEVEDALSKECGLTVTIHDRQWILDRVVESNLEVLANEELQIGIPFMDSPVEGPRDLERKRWLGEIEAELETWLAAGQHGLRESAAAVKAARLAREMELPRIEVEGRYLRAVDLARRTGFVTAQIEATYQYAWTSFWWFEDIEKFLSLYPDLESVAIKSGHPAGLRQLYTLWTLLLPLERLQGWSRKQLEWSERTQQLSEALFRKSDDGTQPSAALEAKAMLKMMELHAMIPHVPPNFDREMREILISSEGLVGFPVDSLLDILFELCKELGTGAEWDSFHEWLVEFSRNRRGEIGEARLRLERSIDLMEAGRICDALVLAGKTLVPFYREETPEELIDGLYVCAVAYEHLGLLWAARGTLIHAASNMFNRIHNDSSTEGLRTTCFRRLKWIELRLGRIVPALEWYTIQTGLEGTCELPSSMETREDLPEPRLFDGALGLLLLRTELDALKALEMLPDALDRLGLPMSSVGLLYALGWEDKVPEVFRENDDELFTKWLGQPAGEKLPATPDVGMQDPCHLRSRILGCKIEVSCSLEPPCLLLAESLLAALEALMATGYRQQIISPHPKLCVTISMDESAGFPFHCNFEEWEQNDTVKVLVPRFNPHKVEAKDLHSMNDALQEFLAQLVARVFRASDFEKAFAVVFGEERAFERAIGFTGSLVTLGNVLGDKAPAKLQDWIQPTYHSYALTRIAKWDADRTFPAKADREEGDEPQDPPPKTTTDVDHSAIENLSLIDTKRWDNAGWAGILYAAMPGGDAPPILAFLFRNRSAGEAIFADWRKRWGNEDREDQLRIVIIRGITRNNPNAYRVLLTSNLPERPRGASYFIVANRVHTLEPTSTENLDRFLCAQSTIGRFFVGFAVASDFTPEADFPSIERQWLFLKRRFEVRDAWTIGQGEIDSAGIEAEDDPIIPARHATSAPVLQILNNGETPLNRKA